MPTQVSYPGVYVEEIPSGVRTITGVSTSITAFIGWSSKGPTDKAQRIQSWGDFERYFGGLDGRSYLGYSVYQFFQNGGQDAYVVRLVASDAKAASASLAALAGMTISAKNQGKWGEDYGVKITPRTGQTDRFRLEVMAAPPGSLTTPPLVVETFENLSATVGDRRYVQTVINNESLLIKVESGAPAAGTPATGTPATDLIAAAGGTRLAGGANGILLEPNDSAFETALNPTTGVSGVKWLDYVDLFNLLCVPGETNTAVLAGLQQYCRENRAFLIADCAEKATFTTLETGPGGITGDDAINAAFYFPWIYAPDPNQENRPRAFPPCGFVAGLYAKTDASRGVFKAPAGVDASLSGVIGVVSPLTDKNNGVLNKQAINCIRNFPVYGTVIWGARTLRGNDEIGSEWKYIPVRRLTLFMEETLYRNTKWAVFEPNDEPLWSQLRLNIGAFMNTLFRQGAFQGRSPQEAYFVKCDKETTTQNDINLGIVNIVVGFAPLKPAEFVILKFQQIAGQIAV